MARGAGCGDGDGDGSAAGRGSLRDVRRDLDGDGEWGLDWEGMEAFLPRGSAAATRPACAAMAHQRGRPGHRHRGGSRRSSKLAPPARHPRQRRGPSSRRTRAPRRRAVAPSRARSGPGFLARIGQQGRRQPQQRQERRHAVHPHDAVDVRQVTQPGGADPADAEHQPEHQAGHQPHAARHGLLRIHHQRGEGGRHHQPDHDGEHRRPRQAYMRQRQRERRHAQERDPDHRLAADAVAHRPARERARRHRREEQEQEHLARLHPHVEALDQVEREVVGERRDIDELREHQHADHGHGPHHAGPVQPLAAAARQATGLRRPVVPHPRREPVQHEDRQQRRHHEPRHRRLAVRDHDRRRQQRPDGRARVAAHLERGLRRAEPPARRQPRDARSLRMERGRTHAHRRRRDQEHRIAVRHRQQRDAQQRHAHARRQQVRLGMFVGVEPDPGLQQRRRHLVHQRDDPDLPEAQREIRLQHREDRRQHRLDHVVEQMGEGCAADDGEQEALGRGVLRRRVGCSGRQGRRGEVRGLRGICGRGGHRGAGKGSGGRQPLPSLAKRAGLQ